MTCQSSADIDLDQVVNNAHDGVFVMDKERRYVLFNKACERLTGYLASEVLGARCGAVGLTECQDEQGRDLDGPLCPSQAVLSGETSSTRQRLQITTKTGEHRWVEVSCTPALDPDGRPECVICVMREISELKEREQQWLETTNRLREEVERLQAHMRERYGFANIVSRSPRMKAVFEKIRAACSNGSPVLITGESGTGKETAARAIHFNGLQEDGPFVSMTCTGLSRELIEAELFGYKRGSFAGAAEDYPGLYLAADGGTLFLDEISALPDGTQARLLRAIQDRSVTPVGSVEQATANVRVIAASCRSVPDLLTSGKLREDLHYRLGVIAIDLPPLRARKEDIPFLVHSFIEELNQQGTRRVTEIERAAWDILDACDWPGNVRELRNAVESAFVSGCGQVLEANEIAAAVRGRDYMRDEELEKGTMRLDDTLADVERRTILAALRRARGQRSLAAKLMGISRSRLYRRMDALGIVPREERL